MDAQGHDNGIAGEGLNGNAGTERSKEQVSPADLLFFSWPLNAAGVAVTIWLIIAPQNNRWAVLAAATVPWVALMLVANSAGGLTILPSKYDPHPSVTTAFLAPGLALTMRAADDLHPLYWKPMLMLAAVLAAVMGAGAIAADRWLRARVTAVVGVVIACGLWGFGAGLDADWLLDASPATVYSASVVAKRVSHGRHNSYYLNLTEWGPKPEAGEVNVPARFYYSVGVGDVVCLPLRRGALAVEWYRVERCR